MRKFFLLIPLLSFALLANATETTIGPNDPAVTVNNTLISALSSASDGDVIILTDGIYNESSDYLVFDKNVEVKAATGATPIIQLTTYIKVQGAKHPIISGLTFDGSVQGTDRSQYFRFTDANNNELELNNCIFNDVKKNIFRCESGKKFVSLEVNNCKFVNSLSNVMKLESSTCGSVSFDGCEFSGTADIVILGKSGSHLDECVVNNCYFHNNAQQSIYFEAGTDVLETCAELTVTNSTFANTTALTNWISIIDVRPYGSSMTDAIKVTIDHCTFYNNPTVDSGHADIRLYKLSDATVSNCIFAHPEAYERRATYNYGGTISNCLTYNLTYDASRNAHRQDGGLPVLSNNFTADPLFNDLANNKYTYAGNWVTMSISPARGAATDGSDLGDPRWYSAETLPESNFITPYAFIGAKAVVRDNMELDANNYIHSKAAGGSAIWKIHATRACNVQVTLNMDPDGEVIGHNYQVEIFDADGNSIGALDEGGWKNNVDDKVLAGTIAFPDEGDYKIELTNSISGTKSTIKGITLGYVGGAVVAVPAEELVGTEAVLVDNGHKKVYKLANGDLQYDDNGTPLGEYVYWNINATKRGNMKVTLNVVAPTEGSASTHDFLVELYSDLSGSPIASSAEAAATSGTGAKVLPDAINIPATGSYIIKLTNRTQYSSAILHSIEFEYLGGATITVPAEALIGEEAVIVDEGHLRVSKLANGDLQYGDNGTPLGEYVYWNINATKYGRMNVTANVVAPTEGSASGHQFLVELYSDLSGSPIASSAEAEATSATGAITMPAFNIPATGNYIIKLTNQKEWSSAILHSIEFAYAGGEVADVPGQIVAADAMLLKEDGGTLKMYINDDGDLQYGNNGYNLTEYAVWNINATEAGEMIVTLNVTHSGHLFTVELYDGATLKSSVAEPNANEWRGGNIELEDHLTIPAAGSYTIKLINRQQYSTGAIHGITFTKYVPATAITMSDTDTNTDAWSAYKDGAAVNVTLNRTILGGMLNAICLPFALTNSQVKAAFGNDVQWYYLNEASLENEVLDLQFAAADDIYPGTPYLMKTSSNVTNPTFNSVVIKLTEASATYHTGWPISFQGTFVQTTIDADGQDMLIYSNNQVGFPDANKTLKGFRAYFHLSSPSLAPSIKTARIITPNNTPTVINLVNGQQSSAQSQKLLIDGRLIIVRDGVQYNVIGARVK